MEIFVKIIVISLRTSTERRTSMEEQLDRIGVEFEFFDAMTPETSRNHIHCYDAYEFISNWGRPATDTEIACHASHRAVWQQCAEEGRPYLVLEDDAELGESFLAGLMVAASQVK